MDEERDLDDVLPPTGIPPSQSQFDRAGGKHKKSYPPFVRRSGRLMQSELVPIMEKAELNAAKKSLEVCTSSEPGLSENSILGTTLVKVMFSSVS